MRKLSIKDRGYIMRGLSLLREQLLCLTYVEDSLELRKKILRVEQLRKQFMPSTRKGLRLVKPE
jgi:hypothetical protein